jgi:transposase
LGELRWLCRVPRTLSEARRVLAETPREAFVQSEAHEGYRIAQRRSDYGGVGQRWLVVHSEELEKAARQRLERRLQRRERQLEREYWRLVGAKTFACQADALAAAQAFAAKNLGQHHRLGSAPRVVEVASYGNKGGRPARGVEPEEVRYRPEAPIERDREAIDQELERAGRYLLATNDGLEVMDSEGEQGLSAEELLREYKDQSHVERGFKFLKDPLFFASSVFVKSPRRVAAIAMVMGLCVLVYALGERSLREALARAGASIRHQRGKQTPKPTLRRWVFQLFQAIHLLRVEGVEQISNLTEERRTILDFLGHDCRRYYLLI